MDKLDTYIDNEKINFFVERTEKHRALVLRAFSFLLVYDPLRFRESIFQIIDHDMSKYSEEESPGYIILTWKYKLLDEGKEVNLPQEIEDEIQKTIFRHTKVNRHHPAYFANDLILEKEAVKQMLDSDIVCQICDWQAVAWEKGTNAFEWARSVIGTRWDYTLEQVKLIYELLSILKLYDEKYREL